MSETHQDPGYGQHPQQPPYGNGPYPPPWAPYPPQPPRRRRSLTLLLTSLVLALLLLIGSLAYAVERASTTAGMTTSRSQSMDPAAVAASISPGLVDVNTVLGEGAEAAGTGIVLTSTGEVLTNHHVIEGATSIQVTDIGNGRTYQARVVGYDRTQDIAVLQLQGASGLVTAATGDSSQVGVGDQVVGVGNAGGTGGTPSYAAGTVTALDQSVAATDASGGNPEQLSGMIQVNADIRPGDSGGPLVDTSGRVIGVDTASSASQSTGPNGASPIAAGRAAPTQGFAVPINEALSVAQQIESGAGSSTVHIGGSAMLGVAVLGSGADWFGSSGTVSGVVVGQALADGPAAKAGIVAGDVIVALGGEAVDSSTGLTNLLEQYHPGDKVAVTWVDQAQQQHTATVQLASGPIR